MNPESLEQVASAIESTITAIGIVIGGLWTYNRFIRQRTERCRVNISDRTTCKVVSPDHILLHVESQISNIGNVLVPLELARTIVYQVLPLGADLEGRLSKGEKIFAEDRTVIPWPKLERRVWRWPKGKSEIEPGETQKLNSEFFIPRSTRAVQITTYLEDSSASQQTGWTEKSLIDVEEQLSLGKGGAMNTTEVILKPGQARETKAIDSKLNPLDREVPPNLPKEPDPDPD